MRWPFRPTAQRLLLTALAVAALLVLASGKQIRPSEVLRTLQHVGVGAAVVAMLLTLVQVMLLQTRLWFVFPRADRPRWFRVAYAFSVGHLVNHFLPVRSGDVAKVALLGGPPAQTAGVLIADKALDMSVLFGLLLCVGTGGLAPMGSGSRWALLLLLAAAALLLVLGRRSGLIRRLAEGMRAVRNPRQLAGAAAMAFCSWSAEIVALHYLAAALGFDLGFAAAVRVLVMLNLGIAIPVSVANLGTYEATVAIGLHAAGMTLTEGVAIGAAYHVIQILGVALFAAGFGIAKQTAPTSAPDAR